MDSDLRIQKSNVADTTDLVPDPGTKCCGSNRFRSGFQNKMLWIHQIQIQINLLDKGCLACLTSKIKIRQKTERHQQRHVGYFSKYLIYFKSYKISSPFFGPKTCLIDIICQGISICFNMLKMALCGSYVNFGVFR